MHCTVQRARTALHYTVHSTRAALYTYRRIVRIVHIPYTVRTVQPRDYRPRGTIREGALLFSAREWLDFYSGGASIRGGLLFARIRYAMQESHQPGMYILHVLYNALVLPVLQLWHVGAYESHAGSVMYEGCVIAGSCKREQYLQLLGQRQVTFAVIF